MLTGLTHLWAQTNPTAQVSLFGLVNIPAPFFPWSMLAMDLLNGGPWTAVQSFTGLASAHLYYFLTEVSRLRTHLSHLMCLLRVCLQIYPTQSGRPAFGFLSPPAFLSNYLGNGTPPPNPTGGTGGRSSTDTGVYRSGGGWGIRPSGNRLGGTPGARTQTAPAATAADTRAAGGRVGTTAREATGGATYRWGSGNRLGEQ